MRFNKDQREGVAKILDNLATASMVALIVSGLIDKKFGVEITVLLVGGFVVLVSIGLLLRKNGGT